MSLDPALILALVSSFHPAIAIRGAATAGPTDVQEERAVSELHGEAVAHEPAETEEREQRGSVTSLTATVQHSERFLRHSASRPAMNEGRDVTY